ncbi:RidA family protein [Marinibaculum pumilum]|uniref:RidA family protein n=1 Tax=Marinibaculum pumilum TaxID=1766165 RepID=A0ABV7L444_9PROT
MPRDAIDLPADDPAFGSTKSFESFQFSPAVRARGFVYVSGQVGRAPDGSMPADLAEQADLAFRRIGLILQQAGLDYDDIVELVSYHVDLPAHLPGFIAVKERYMKPPYPAWTMIGVSALAHPDLKVEIKAVAAER